MKGAALPASNDYGARPTPSQSGLRLTRPFASPTRESCLTSITAPAAPRYWASRARATKRPTAASRRRATHSRRSQRRWRCSRVRGRAANTRARATVRAAPARALPAPACSPQPTAALSVAARRPSPAPARPARLPTQRRPSFTPCPTPLPPAPCSNPTPPTPRAGGQDRLADPADADLLLKRLDPDWVVARRHQPDYAHLDFLWGINAPRRVYGDVLELLRAGPALRRAMLARRRGPQQARVRRRPEEGGERGRAPGWWRWRPWQPAG
jgi:hypothetical protein